MIKKLLWLALIINFVYVVMGVAKYGSQHVDAYGIWLLKARGWTVEGGVPLKLLRDPRYSYSHQQYPLLLPAMMAGWTRLTGSLESFLWLYPLIYGCILYILYTLSMLEGWKRMAGVVVASFMGPLMAQGGRLHAGLADIWITLLVGLGLLAVRNKSYCRLAVIIMIASQIKTEGVFLVALFWGIKGTWRQKLPWMSLALVPFLWWQWQVRMWRLSSDIGFYWPGIVELARRFGIIIGSVVKEMLNWRNWYVIWPIWWLMPKRNMEARVLGLMSLGYVGVYLFSTIDPAGYVSSSIDRLLLQTLPVWWGQLARGRDPRQQ